MWSVRAPVERQPTFSSQYGNDTPSTAAASRVRLIALSGGAGAVAPDSVSADAWLRLGPEEPPAPPTTIASTIAATAIAPAPSSRGAAGSDRQKAVRCGL